MMAVAARDAMATDQIEAIADKGYYKSEEILACEQAGIEVVVPKPQTSNARARGQFDNGRKTASQKGNSATRGVRKHIQSKSEREIGETRIRTKIRKCPAIRASSRTTCGRKFSFAVDAPTAVIHVASGVFRR